MYAYWPEPDHTMHEQGVDTDDIRDIVLDIEKRTEQLARALPDDTLLMLTADHGCDPAYTATTDHTREYTPLLMYSPSMKPADYGTRSSFSDIAATVLDLLAVTGKTDGVSLIRGIQPEM